MLAKWAVKTSLRLFRERKNLVSSDRVMLISGLAKWAVKTSLSQFIGLLARFWHKVFAAIGRCFARECAYQTTSRFHDLVGVRYTFVRWL